MRRLVARGLLWPGMVVHAAGCKRLGLTLGFAGVLLDPERHTDTDEER